MNVIKFNCYWLSRVFIVIALFVSLVSCDNKKAIKNLTGNYLISVEYMEQEKGIEPYKVRLIVSEKYLRIDDGGVSDGFILFDRLKNEIYNINNDDKTILEINTKRKDIVSPITLKDEDIKIAVLTEAPKLNDTIPVEYELKTNGVVCLKMIVVKNLLPNVEQALRSFKQALANDSTTTLDSMPTDLLNPCDLSMNTFNATRFLKYGFPIQIWNEKGYSRTLTAYDENFKSKTNLFVLPKNYRSFSIEQLRMGN